MVNPIRVRGRRAWAVAWMACAVATCVGPAAGSSRAPDSPFAVCARPAGARWSYDDLLCLFRVGAQHGALAEARSRLRRLGAGGEEQPWPTLVLAHATVEADEAQAIRLYEAAAAGFARTKEAEGEVVARQNLRNIYQRRGDLDSAWRQVERALVVAEASKQPLTLARASVLEASHLIGTGGDLGRAHRALLRAEDLVFPDGPLGLRRSILYSLATVSLYLGRPSDAIDALERHRALQREDGSPVNAAAVAYNLLTARLTMSEERPSPGDRARLVTVAEEVLSEAQGLGQTATVAHTHHVLGDLLRESDPDRATVHLARCLELEARLRHPDLRAGCLWSLSLLEAARDPARAERLSREAIALLAPNRGGSLLAFAWQARLRLVWRTLREDEAIPASLEAIEAIERLRAGQKDESSRAALFSNWTRDYYWLAGRLLEAQPPRLPEAFEVGERLRARGLLEQLARAGLTTTADPNREAAVQRVEHRIVDTQRLLSSALANPERVALLEQLQLLELEKAELDDGGTAAVAQPGIPFASLDAVQQTLDSTEAMLWFSIASWKDVFDDFGGGSWLVCVTRRAVTFHRLPARFELDSQVLAFAGLLSQRDTPLELWSPAAARLGATLVGKAIAELPPEIKRLVVVSDGVLHRLPFEALRTDSSEQTLGERFEITMAPSATLWLHLRRSELMPSSGKALVLADPEVPRGNPIGTFRLEPLPWARREARAIARTLRLDAGQVREGSAASERFLKETPLESAAVLHLATHAWADAAFPDRSAVFLAPGGATEDGWLQPREIAALDLRGRLVVLSACESADGALLSGEGPLSLARAFFAGGAGGVVATRWPLRDDDAAFLMERFYRSLASGVGAGAALRRARHDAIAAGRSPAAWAGIVLLGDGLRPPFRAPEPPVLSWLVLAVVITAAGLGWHALRVLRKRGSP